MNSSSQLSSPQDRLPSADLAALEATRIRINQLLAAVSTFQQRIAQHETLPPWPTIQSTTQILTQNLSSISEHLSTHSTRLSSHSVLPSSTFPIASQESLLLQLLRKKPEQDIETAVLSAEKRAVNMHESVKRDIESLQSEAGLLANEEAKRHRWGGNYTLKEREGGIQNVDTGLRRVVSDDESEDEDEDDDEEEEKAVQATQNAGETKEVKRPELSLDAHLRMLTRGRIS